MRARELFVFDPDVLLNVLVHGLLARHRACEERPDCFTAAETERLAQRFAPLHARLHTETEQFVPGFQSGPTRHRFEHMPPDFELDDFIASWNGAA